MTTHFSTRCPNSDYLGFEASPEAIVAAAKKAEEVGFDAVFVNDHIIVGADVRSEPWTNVYDPLVAMSFVAAHTSRIGVGVSVLIMPTAIRSPPRKRWRRSTSCQAAGSPSASGSAGMRPSSRPLACRSTSVAPAQTSTCAYGSPAGPQAKCRFPAGSFRLPICSSIPSPCSNHTHRSGSAGRATARCGVRQGSPRYGSRRRCR